MQPADVRRSFQPRSCSSARATTILVVTQQLFGFRVILEFQQIKRAV
jgi:hypothetical protein